MKRIAVVTTSRADYSHLYWPLKDLEAHPAVDLKLIVLAAHLSPEFGFTVREIERDGLPIAVKLECLLSSDSDIGMAKSIGVGILALADALGQMRPDVLLLIADRFEMLAPASVALALRIPIAHIEGGEVSEGAIDDAVRNALTKMAHVHFTSTHTARQRVIGMGEEPWRVHHVGAPSLDHIRRSHLPSRRELEEALGLDLSTPPVLVAYHPVTLLRDTTSETDALFQALRQLPGHLVFCYPNADAGSRQIIERTKAFLQERGQGHLFINLPAVTYWGLLRCVRLIVGNSSSGIMESGSFALPTVNVGIRQKGREHGPNVLHAEASQGSILEKIRQAQTEDFLSGIRNMVNPYGDGQASERIVRVLTTLPPAETLLLKRHALETP